MFFLSRKRISMSDLIGVMLFLQPGSDRFRSPGQERSADRVT